MGESYDLPEPEHFTAGAVGPKGQRVFYLQAGASGQLVSLKLEKQQVLALAEFLDRALQKVADDPESIIAEMDLGLIDPVEPAWVVASLGIAYDQSSNRLVVLAHEEEQEEDTTSEAGVARFHLTLGQVAGFVEKARHLIAAGRPPCRYCGAPLNDDGAWCACFN